MMAELERILRGAYELGALGATEEGQALYAARNWQRWRGPTSALTPTGIKRTPDEDGSIFVLPVNTPLDLDGELTCDWRDGDVW
jgi:aminoglycoside 2'-N-acetyltransferase I